MANPSSRPAAIVSGGSSGIGAACARRLAAGGLDVLVAYSRNGEGAERTAEACRSEGVEARLFEGDVADDACCRGMVAEAVAAWGGVDVLINNAGITRFADPDDLESQSREDFERIFAVNVTGAYQLARAAAPHLGTSGLASVVNVSSHSGFSGIGSSIAYAASKGALNTLTLSLALALAPAIRVNAVCPGFVDTRWLAGKFDDHELAAFKEHAADIAPLKRLVTPEDVAEAVGWFALGGDSITGQLLVIDGGTHLTVGGPL